MITVRVLLSGGMDSALCLALALDQGARPTAVFCEYGQRHRVMEAGAAALIAAEVSVPMVTVRGLDLGRGRLTGDEDGDLDAEGAVLPGRNRALLRAAAWAGGTRADLTRWRGSGASRSTRLWSR
jgi:7-cyano-7-deazaguanine synthase